MDIDFAMRQLSNTTENIVQIVKGILSVNTGNDYIIFDILETEPITEHREYNGVRVKLTAHIKNTRTPFHVDIAVGDVIVPKPEPRQLPTQLDEIERPEILT